MIAENHDRGGGKSFAGKPVGEWCPTLVGKLFRLLVGPSDVPTYPVRKSGNNIEVVFVRVTFRI